MKKYRVEITRSAERDILEIRDYISIDNPKAAMKWIAEIERQIGTLEKMPIRCPVIPESRDLGIDYRHLIYGNYRTIFRVIMGKVVIMRVIHSSRLLSLE